MMSFYSGRYENMNIQQANPQFGPVCSQIGGVLLSISSILPRWLGCRIFLIKAIVGTKIKDFGAWSYLFLGSLFSQFFGFNDYH